MPRKAMYTEPLFIRLTPAMIEAVRAAAQVEDRNPSEWAREVIRRRLEADRQRKRRAVERSARLN